MKTLLGVHKTLKLSLWVVLANGSIIRGLLFGSLLISLGDGLIHLSLHLGSLNSSFFNGQIAISDHGIKLEIDWVRWNWQDGFAAWEDGLWPSISSVFVQEGSEVRLQFGSDSLVNSVLSSRLQVVHINWFRSNRQKWLTSWNDKTGISIITEFLILELNTVVTKGSSELGLKLMSNVGSSNRLNADLEIELF